MTKFSLIYDGTNHYIQKDNKNIFYVSSGHSTTTSVHIISEERYIVPILRLYTSYNNLFFETGYVQSYVSFADVLRQKSFHDLFYFDNNNFILKDNFTEFVIFDSENDIRTELYLFNIMLEPVSDFDTILYSELLDNSEQFQMAKSFLNDTDPEKELDPTYWTDTQLKFFKFVEEYNKNVLSLRATKKVDAKVNGSISQSGQSDIDLSPVVQQLSNLNNKLQRVDENQETKNITQTINDLSLSNQTVITTVESAPYNPLLDDGSDIDF